MAARMQQGGRPGGARFAQFKLVLLGTYTRSPCGALEDADMPQASLLSESPRSSSASLKYADKHLVCSKAHTSLLIYVRQDQFDDYRESTIGAAFLTQTIALDDQTTVKFEIWDTAGQERYKSLAPMYYRNANCAVVVYDITQAVRMPEDLHSLDEDVR